MTEDGKVRRTVVLIACGAFAVLMTLTPVPPPPLAPYRWIFIARGLPVRVHALLSLIRRCAADRGHHARRCWSTALRLRVALPALPPQSSTDAVVVAILPFWWVPTGGRRRPDGGALWAVSRRTRPARLA
jgi:hypothetical protein